MSKVTKPIGKMAHTRGLILMFLQTRGRPARTSEIRQAVLANTQRRRSMAPSATCKPRARSNG
jgi:hypothetical protein